MSEVGASLSAFVAARDPVRRDRLALAAPGVRLTFGELGERVAGASAALEALRVESGARIALPGASDLATVIAFLALAELGALPVFLHPRLTPFESKTLVAVARSEIVLDADAIADVTRGRAPVPQPVSFDDQRPYAIVFTSGTSGTPKQAILPRRAFVASARASATNLAFGPGDAWLSSLPLAHVGGLGVITKALVGGGAVRLEPRFDPDAVLAHLAAGDVSLVSLVPTMLDAVLERDRGGALARARAVLLGGAPASASLLERAAIAGVLTLSTYGLTEACSQVTTQAVRDPRTSEPGSGRALPGVELAIRREDGSTCAAHEAGRIAVRGPTLMMGYDDGPNAPPDRARDGEGWFDTGDLGELDAEGRLFVHARRTDLILTGGENVYPAEVEQALEAVPGVRRAVVFGVPDARWGQIVAAALEVDAGVDVAEAITLAGARLAPHKRPRVGGIAERVELGPTGKVDRRGVLERYAAVLEPITRR